MIVTIIGASGFVGSAFVRVLSRNSRIQLIAVNRQNYDYYKGVTSQVVIDVSCNSKKFLAEETPLHEFPFSVENRLKTLLDFPAECHIHVSSVDVYSRLDSAEYTSEESCIEIENNSHYGFHKYLAEQIVKHYAKNWLIIRLAGLVGEGIKKNPVYDIINNLPLRIHPFSKYQFMNTEDAATLVLKIYEMGLRKETINICGDGLITPLEIAEIAKVVPRLELIHPNDKPRIVDINVNKLKSLAHVPQTIKTIEEFISKR